MPDIWALHLQVKGKFVCSKGRMLLILSCGGNMPLDAVEHFVHDMDTSGYQWIPYASALQVTEQRILVACICIKLEHLNQFCHTIVLKSCCMVNC